MGLESGVGRRWNLNSIEFKFRYGDLITRLQHTRIFMVNFMAINHRPEPKLCCSPHWQILHYTHCSQARTQTRLQVTDLFPKKPHSKYHFNKHYCTIALSAVQYYCHLRVYFVLFQQLDARCCWQSRLHSQNKTPYDIIVRKGVSQCPGLIIFYSIVEQR